MADEPQKEKVEQAEAQEATTEATEAAEEAIEAAEEVATVISSDSEKSQDSQSTDSSAAPQNDKAKKPVSANLEKIIEQIEKLSVLELADLVNALEDRFGVTAAAPVVVAAAGAGAAAGEPAEEKTTFNVILSAAGANKISVIKAARELVPTLGLKEAKDLVEAAPKPVLEGVGKEAAEEAKKKLETAGGTVELQ